MSYRPNILGLDLSLAATGVATPDGETLLLETSPSQEDDARVDDIAAGIGDLLLGQVDLVVMEGGVFRSQAAFRLGMVHRAARVAIRESGRPFILVAPAALKKYATGKGTASKSDMRLALFKRAMVDEADDNRVDAWWLRAMALDYYGHPVCSIPESQRAALVKVRWPALADIT